MKNEIHRNPSSLSNMKNQIYLNEDRVASAGLAIVFPASSLPIPLLSNQSFS